MQCAGKIVLVTGAQQGIGRAMALEFAGAGADVAVNWVDDAQIEQTQAMTAAVERELGPIDILINNAGVFPRVSFLEMTESDWDHVLDVNLKGSCFCAQAVAKAMVSAGRPGVIVNLTSGAAYRS